MLTHIIVAAMLAGVTAVNASSAQSIEQRVRSVGDGTTQIRFASRPGVCGDGRTFIAAGRNHFMGTMNFSDTRGDSDWRANCVPGPVRVVLSVRGGDVDNVRAYVGPERETKSSATDLGMFPARQASDYLLSLARTGTGRVGEESIIPAMLADSASPWPSLLASAGDSLSRPRATRDAAFFWLSRGAAARVNGNDLFNDDSDDNDEKGDVANSAVFALSQLKHHEGVDPLLEVARKNKNPHLRSSALFWLGQSRDPRALALFEQILR